MPNYCDYQMEVKGNQDNVLEFIKIMQSDYHINSNGECDCDRHFWRVFEANVEDKGSNGDIYYAIIGGYCAWSVVTCMCDGIGSYNNSYKNAGGTTLKNESKRLNLTIEVFSKEPGMCFMEHIVYKNGECLVDDCVDYYEYYTGDFESVDEMNKEYDTQFTQEEFESDEWIGVGGLDWIFGTY